MLLKRFLKLHDFKRSFELKVNHVEKILNFLRVYKTRFVQLFIKRKICNEAIKL